MLFDLMSLSFYCDIQMVESEFDDTLEPSNFVSVVQAAGGSDIIVFGVVFLTHVGPLLTRCLNAMDYLRIISDHVHPLIDHIFHVL